MDTRTQGRRSVRPEDLPSYIVGMDAHSRKLAISVWEWSDVWRPVLHKEIKCCDIAAMEKTFENHVPLDSLTVIEASTNSAMLKRRLAELGYRAEVVRADVIAERERKRKVCDIQDARNLAHAFMKGEVREFVWTSSPEYEEYKDVLRAYRDTVKEMTRTSNRIWNVCSQKGYDLPIRAGATKADSVRKMVEELRLSGIARSRLEMLVDDYERLLERRDGLMRLMAETVVSKPEMVGLLQLPGVGFRTAFATGAVVEDARRFPSASKLAAYGGFAPTLDTSGEEEERARARGGTGKPLDGEGRRDLKFFYTEAGQTVLASCAKMPVGKWGWSMLNRGKPRNKVVCAIGHKLLTYAWHIMRGDPTPNRLGEAFFRRKMHTFYSRVGADRMRELGYVTRASFEDAMAERVYGRLPGMQTAS